MWDTIIAVVQAGEATAHGGGFWGSIQGWVDAAIAGIVGVSAGAAVGGTQANRRAKREIEVLENSVQREDMVERRADTYAEFLSRADELARSTSIPEQEQRDLRKIYFRIRFVASEPKTKAATKVFELVEHDGEMVHHEDIEKEMIAAKKAFIEAVRSERGGTGISSGSRP